MGNVPSTVAKFNIIYIMRTLRALSHLLAAHGLGAAHGALARMSWARLLKRVFDIDIERYP